MMWGVSGVPKRMDLLQRFLALLKAITVRAAHDLNAERCAPEL